MNDIRDRIRGQIVFLESMKEGHQARMEQAVEEFRRSAANYDAYQIVTFIEGRIQDIKHEREKIKELDDTIRMLRYLIKE